MEYRFLVVKLAHPYKFNDHIESFDMLNLSKNEHVCLYVAETNRRHDQFITLTPVSTYAVMFPVDSIHENVFRKLTNKRTFSVSDEFMKAQGFADYVKQFMDYLKICKENPNKYYMMFGNNIIKYKQDQYFVNGAHFFYGEIINMAFRNAWEYEDLKLKKYNIFKRLFS